MSIQQQSGVGSKRTRSEEPADRPENSKLTSSHVEDARDELLRSCAVFRVMNGAAIVGKNLTLLRRGDVVEVIKCKFGPKEISKALGYFRTHFTTSLTKLRFQAWLSSTQEVRSSDGEVLGDAVTIFSQVALQRNAETLRTCDLSRNRFNSRDVPLLLGLQGLALAQFSNLEVLDLSYNPIGNTGAAGVFEAIQKNASIRAVVLKHCNIDDEGASAIGDFLRARPRPEHNSAQKASAFYLKDEIKLMFFVNLNGNRIGAHGTRKVSYRLPDYVSVTVVGQQPVMALTTVAKDSQI